MLRLVGGTEVTNAAGKLAAQSKQDRERLPTVPPSPEADLARKLILEHPLAGSTIGTLIEASSRNPDATSEERWASVSTYTKACIAFQNLGIILCSGGLEEGLALDSFATVVDTKRLLRRIPALKKLPIDLTGLALY
jgi:hypothetical protein